MSDDLRDRIATALQARDEAATTGITDPFMVEQASYDDLADAVIRELKLLDLVKKLEAEIAELLNRAKANPLNRDSLLDRATGMEQALFAVRRYVTEWENDD